jgi:pimeloyl-ACP methyl ester carboxylesterase
MRFRAVLKRSGRGVAAPVTANPVADAPPNHLGGQERWFEWRGRWVAFTQRGHGSPLVLVHGLHSAASSYEWRDVVEALAAQHTVYTIDLLGFGRSARPRMRYTPALYQGLLADFAARIIGEPCVLVAHGLSAAYAIAVAARDPLRFPALITIAPTGLVRHAEPVASASSFRRVMLTLPVIGAGLFNASVSRPKLRAYLEDAYADDDLVTDALVESYYDVSHRVGARYAPAALRTGGLNADIAGAVKRLSQPMLLVWGARARLSPVDESLGFRALKQDADVAVIEAAGDLPHAERPAQFVAAALAFLDRLRPTLAPRRPVGVLKETA